ncbi:hypothetical protein L596_008480 [Steinernema carpocapsae]|uniref:Ubiquitin-like domain-containing protein n=1 Tax=Steinernema carpocapsae TaxID=34508 RepID=A0A4V6A6B3_STECR|nr:hypothetical protein L596_008480 [Steinernema carpocapsae]
MAPRGMMSIQYCERGSDFPLKHQYCDKSTTVAKFKKLIAMAENVPADGMELFSYQTHEKFSDDTVLNKWDGVTFTLLKPRTVEKPPKIKIELGTLPRDIEVSPKVAEANQRKRFEWPGKRSSSDRRDRCRSRSSSPERKRSNRNLRKSRSRSPVRERSRSSSSQRYSHYHSNPNHHHREYQSRYKPRYDNRRGFHDRRPNFMNKPGRFIQERHPNWSPPSYVSAPPPPNPPTIDINLMAAAALVVGQQMQQKNSQEQMLQQLVQATQIQQAIQPIQAQQLDSAPQFRVHQQTRSPPKRNSDGRFSYSNNLAGRITRGGWNKDRFRRY